MSPDVNLNDVVLNDDELELVRREMMKSAAKDLQHASSELEHLAELAPWPMHQTSGDAQGAVRMAREGLDLVDRLGWPRDETREESAARIKAKEAKR